ncbi:hypothetical protein [Deinococcus hopiensis]|uniref:Cell division protein FtsL n=1 Tax=Deinococcus hopiensis KR-140 TaxID=695939 RepID=A0A1W1VG75_9DEIO|nr:hypothetical protein [Deinococcus hopiensis]SMB92220.1 hypothetical protein SAMN00790413_01483 [Deinococcus hopiensis KR-140]
MTVSRFDFSLATWQSRAIRYMVIYLLLALALVASRYLTQDIRPSLRAAQDREAKLITARDELEVEVQRLSSPQRVRDWASQNGLRSFAEAPKTKQSITGVTPPPPAPVRTTLEVNTEWK